MGKSRQAKLRPTVSSPSEADVARILRLLRSWGLRCTQQRETVVRALLCAGSHPSAKELYHVAHRQGASVSFATVYNTLEKLASLGVLTELTFPGAPARFDLNMRPHVNLVCLNCGTIVDVLSSQLARVMGIVGKASGFEVRSQRLDVYGRCAQCQGTS